MPLWRTSQSSSPAVRPAHECGQQAQQELEQFLRPDSAVRVLQYVDQLVHRAVESGVSGGYNRVDAAGRLAIDSEHFLEELEAAFNDLPPNFYEIFQGQAIGEWAMPRALDTYIQLQWFALRKQHTNEGEEQRTSEIHRDVQDRLEEMMASGTASTDQALRLRRQMNEQGWDRYRMPGAVQIDPKAQNDEKRVQYYSDTDDDDVPARSSLISRRRTKQQQHRRVHHYSESEYDSDDTGDEAEKYSGGYMKPKKAIARDVQDELEAMIASGTAGKDQVLRLQRQQNERGWNRRQNPGAVELNPKLQNDEERVEYCSDTDDDDASFNAESASIKRYQEIHNARRKDRLSARVAGVA